MKLLHYLSAFLATESFQLQLQHTTQNFRHLSLDQLKHHYQTVYEIYAQLPLFKKKQIHPLLNELQETLTNQIQQQNQLQNLLTNFPQSNLKKQAQAYHQINSVHQQLTYPQQQHYLPQILHLRDKMERNL